MTKHEADVIGGLNMTDQISNEAYKQIMVAAQDENEVSDVLDKIKAELHAEMRKMYMFRDYTNGLAKAFEIIDKYRNENI